MKRGFTLIELMAVITVLAVITLAVVPSIIKQVSSKKEEISQTTLDLIYNATDLYISSDKSTYKNEMGSVYCIPLENLVKEDLLDKNITNFKTGKKIPLNRIIKTTVNSYYEFEYQLLDKDQQCYQSIGTILSDVVSIGDYVAYDAGIWTTSSEKPTNQGEVGGYTNGLNKGVSATCYNTTDLSGWRVLNKSGTTVMLVHAGYPECLYYDSNNTSISVNEVISTIANRPNKQYVNTNYAISAHYMNYEEALAITGNKEATTNNLRYLGAKGTTSNNAQYWLATAHPTSSMYAVNSNGSIVNPSNNWFGIRPVIVLKDKIKTSGKGKDAFGQEAWLLLK